MNIKIASLVTILSMVMIVFAACEDSSEDVSSSAEFENPSIKSSKVIPTAVTKAPTADVVKSPEPVVSKPKENPFLRPTPFRITVPTMVPSPTSTPIRPTFVPVSPTPSATPVPRPRPTSTATPTPTSTPTAKEFLENARVNRPTKGPKHRYVFSENVSDELISQHAEIHEHLIDVLGGYDRYVHAIYNTGGENEDLIETLNEFGLLKGEISKTEELEEIEQCLVAVSSFNVEDHRNNFSICIQENPLTDSDLYDERDAYGPDKFQYKIFHEWAQAYFNHYQRVHVFDRSLDISEDCCPSDNSVRAPAWWVDGTAMLFSDLFINEYFYKLTYTQERRLNIEDGGYPFQTRSEWENRFTEARQQMISDGEDGCGSDGSNEEYRESPKCDWVLMNLYLAYISSYQTMFVDLLSDMWELGFDASFEKHVGMTKEKFYGEFNKFIKNGDVGEPSPVGFFPNQVLDQIVDFWAVDSG